ncbi:thioesterase [Streptomyces carminius]|uniref:Thioesterase n=2 Tax=Streptomyces carminius TaxID=2665496 RepID=A0A2M8LRR6_9ACTN|nr:thioesterase family protein [Streptomyces carminius]PJE94635.1 thioesterase [Streptomyces carminius]
MDAFGHVNNVVFLRYLEEARIDFMFRLARQAASGAFTGGSVVARHEISYLRPLTHRHEPVVVELWVTKVGAASVTVAYEVKDGPGDSRDPGGSGAADGEGAGTVYARAATVVVPYDLERERPRRLSDEEKAFLKEYLDDSATGAVAA